MRPRLPASYSLSRRVVTVEELAGLVRRGGGREEVELYTVTLRHRSTDQAVYNRIKTIRSDT